MVKLLLNNGARFNYDDIEVARELCVAATENDVERLMLWKQGKVDLNMPDLDGRTPLHVVSWMFFVMYDEEMKGINKFEAGN